jgi:hypothetical protein
MLSRCGYDARAPFVKLLHERRDTRGVVIALKRIVLHIARRPDVDAGRAARRFEPDVRRRGELARFEPRGARTNASRFGRRKSSDVVPWVKPGTCGFPLMAANVSATVSSDGIKNPPCR